MTDISGAMEAALREWKCSNCDGVGKLRRGQKLGGGLRQCDVCKGDGLNPIASEALSSHPQRDGEGNRGSEPQVPAPMLADERLPAIAVRLRRLADLVGIDRMAEASMALGDANYLEDLSSSLFSPPGADANQQSKTEEKS